MQQNLKFWQSIVVIGNGILVMKCFKLQSLGHLGHLKHITV